MVYNRAILGKDRIVDEQKIREVVLKIAQALDDLHSQGIVLRDFQMKSVMMSDSSDYANPRLCKFDRAIVLGPEEKTCGRFGDERYQAPEVKSGGSYDLKADVWSFGILLFCIVLRKYPSFGSYNGLKDLVKQNKNSLAPIPELSLGSNSEIIGDLKTAKISRSLKDLISKLLNTD